MENSNIASRSNKLFLYKHHVHFSIDKLLELFWIPFTYVVGEAATVRGVLLKVLQCWSASKSTLCSTDSKLILFYPTGVF